MSLLQSLFDMNEKNLNQEVSLYVLFFDPLKLK